MICTLIKWMISQSLDSGRPLSKIVERHAGRCRSCNDFLLASRNLDIRLAMDGVSLGHVPGFAIEEKSYEPSGAWGYSMRLAVSAVCILVLGGLIVSSSLRDTRNGYSVLSSLVSQDGVIDLLSMNGLSMDTIGGNPEARLNQEIVYLAQDARSAARFVTSSISFGIPDLN